MLNAVADTHAVIWYLYNDSRLSPSARVAFDEAAETSSRIGFSPITLAEIVYLGEKGRIDPAVFQRLLTALDRPGAVLWELPFDRMVAAAIPSIDRQQVPDLPDRIIAATARLYGVPLISRDRRITLSDVSTIW